MAAGLHCFASFLLLLGVLHHGFCAPVRSVPQLERSMYRVLEATPCVRLLNLTGEVGCANPGRHKVIAPIVHLTQLSSVPRSPVAVLVPSSQLRQFLSGVLGDPLFAEQVAGVLVESQGECNSSASCGFSADATFPQAEFSGYDPGYVWNPTGSGLVQNTFNFPIFLLSPDGTTLAREVALKNEQSSLQYPVHVAEFDLVMQTTKAGTRTSESCLREWSCLPLGGYSVLSAIPPINSSGLSDKTVVLTTTSMDSMSLFRDSTPGADSPLSGTIALLAAVDVLARTVSLSQLKKQLVFLVLAGEPWGYIGSRRFAAELATGGPSVAGLNYSDIHQILEVGSVGRALGSESITLYAHKQSGQTPEESVELEEILDALQVSASTQGNLSIEVKEASRSNPGLPPSSLNSFSRKGGGGIAGVLLEEYDTAFSNDLYHSHFDTEASINTAAIAGSASLLARTLYILATGHPVDLQSLQALEANETLVEDLVNCLLKADPGMSCSLAKRSALPAGAYPNHYVGVMLGAPAADPYSDDVSDTSRFIWNFLAGRGVHPQDLQGATAEECTQTCSKHSDVCVSSTAKQKGVCVASAARFVPAYSPRLQYGKSGWKLVPAEAWDLMGAADPVWTESFWKTTGLQIYKQEGASFNQLVLLGGTFVTLASILTVASTKALFRKRLKNA